MTDRLKSSLIENYKIESSLLPKTNPLLTSSTLLNKTIGLTSISTERKTKLSIDTCVLEIKKTKLDSENLLNKPSAILTSNFGSLSLSSKFNLTSSPISHSFTTKTLGLTTLNIQRSALLEPKVTTQPINSDPKPIKRHYTETIPSYIPEQETFLQEEYLATDSLINKLNDELKDIEKEFRRNKRLKRSIDSISLDNSRLNNPKFALIRNKNTLINAVSASLLKEPDFKNPKDPIRNLIFNLADNVLQRDPEFILKLALYTRKELNIRVTANFLLCYAAFKNECRPYLQRYFKTSIVLPSDWIDIAEQYQLFVDKRLNFGALPSALRKSMVEKFPDFDRYQLAKYNKEKSRLAKNKSLKDVKHVKSKMKDSDGKTTDITDHKYIKTIENGLKINDRITFEIAYTSECNSLKFDIINRIQTETRNRKEIKKEPKKDESNDLVACRISVDFNYDRIVVKNFLKKEWSNDKQDVIKLPSNCFTPNTQLKFYIDVLSNKFTFGILKEEEQTDKILEYSHNKHKIELNKLNVFRLSGSFFKLQDLSIFSKDKIKFNKEQNDENSETKIKQRSFTLKQLIRQLHISSPVENVMSLLGKKYPLTFEEFMLAKLPGIFDSEKAGKRMKLEIPETWETQISLKGNKSEVWEQLIDNKKLPYMAMLRNLRNMIKAGISEKHHQWVIKKLQDEGAVIHSKQFPFRFFTAYQVLDELEQEFNDYSKWTENPPVRKNKNKKVSNDINYDPSLLKRYKTALDNALKVATTFNVSPIQGSTVIIVNLGREMDIAPGKNGKSLGQRVTSISEMAALLALMFKYSCENSKLIVFADHSSYTNIELEQGTILDNMKSLIDVRNLPVSSKDNINIPRNTLLDLFDISQIYDNLIYLSNGIREVDFMKDILRKYRVDKNENLLFVNVNLAIDTISLSQDPNFDHENDINISGFSDAILRFVAERGNKGQLTHIEHIDKAYDLPELKDKSLNKQDTNQQVDLIEKPKFKLFVPKQMFKTLKVFISSTFRDMHSERDILTRTVFPLLRSKLSSLLINIYEIDLRWGITETEAESNKTLDLCLNQILNSDYFINILGARYGHVLENYSVRKNPELNWLNSYPPGASITELEIETQLRKVEKIDTKYETTFFYFRDNSFINHVPGKYQEHFIDNNDESNEKLRKLKSKIKKTNYEIFDGYKCKWLKCEEFSNGSSRALVCDLDSFAHRVFNNLFNSISKHYKNDVSLMELDETNHFNNLTAAFMKLNTECFVGREKLLIKLDKALNAFVENKTIKVVLLNGEAGSGKTSLLSHYLTNNSSLVHHFIHLVGAYPGSEHISLFLKRFCVSINRIYDFGMQDDELDMNDYNFYKKCFENFLTRLCNEVLGENQKFHIIIDGVDFFVDDSKNIDYSFDWLPENVQSKIVFVFSARSDSQIKSVLNKISLNNTWTNKLRMELIEVENLDLLDKSEFIKSKLAKFNKHLDENPFNNQIKMLTTKRDSANPLYLSLVCEELRTHNQYETLNQKLKEIPMRINLLVNYVLDRLEADFGEEFVSMAFNFICASREGLNEQELKSMLTLYFKIKSLNLIDKLNLANSMFSLERTVLDQILNSKSNEVSTAKFLSFLESISDTFLKSRSKTDESLIQIRSNNYIENSLRTKYGAKNKSIISAKFTSKIMAMFYWGLVENDYVNKWVDLKKNQRGLTYLSFHLVQAEMYQDVLFLLTNIPFLALKCELGLFGEIMNDFDLHQDFKSTNILTKVANQSNLKKQNVKVISDFSGNKKLDDYKTFIQSNYDLLSSNSSLFFQQIFNQTDDSLILKDLKNILISNPNFCIGNLIEWINKEKQTDKYKIYPITIKDFDESISSISLSSDGAQVACGTKNCQIRLYSTTTAKLIRILQGHSGNINSLKFISKEILCSTSSDGKACIWNVGGGYRIKVLDKHNGHVVKDACSDPSGKNLVTVGWDCTAKIWNPTNGNLEGELKGHPRPINCVAFNPDGTLVATGCWDSNIRIFNLYDRVRKAVLRGHNSSIKSIGYSFNGVYIASASIDGDVKLWNSKYGSQIGTLKGHSMPVNSISFSPISQFLITGSTDRRVKVWSGTIGKMIRVIETGSKKPLTSINLYKKTGDIFAVGTHEGDILVYEIHGILRNKCKPHKAFINRIRFTQNGDYIISACNEGKVVITDISKVDSTFKSAELKGSSSSVNGLAVNDFNVIITGAEDCAIRIYPYVLDKLKEKSSERCIEESPIYTLTSHSSPITSISFSSDGVKFASASKDALIKVWNLNHINYDASELYRINNAHLDWITDLEWSNSSDFILTSSNDNTLKIWNAQNGKEKNVLIGHDSNINSCAFQYGCAVSTSYDGSIKVWSHKGNEISTLFGHQSRVNSCDLFVKIRDKNPLDKKKTEVEQTEEMEISSLWADEVEKEIWLGKHKKKLLDKQNIDVEEVYLISCSDDSTIRIWKPIESDYLLSLENHNNSINSVDLDKNFTISTASSDKTVNLWNAKNFFDTVKSGSVVSQNEPNKTHCAEITAICFDQNKEVLLSGSFDGKVIMWKFVYLNALDQNGTQRKYLSNIKFVQEISAHEKSCNSICAIGETDENLFFATSSIDKSVKIWKINKKKNTSPIELVQSFGRNLNQILYINVVESGKDKFLIMVEKETFKILIRKNKITKENRLELSNDGICILNFFHVINSLKMIDNKLYITVPHDEIFVIDIDLTPSKLKFIDMTNSENVKLVQKISSFKSNEKKESETDWYCSMARLGDSLFVGDSKGKLYTADSNILKCVKNIHESRVTSIVSFKNKDEINNFISSSQDGKIKIWSENFEKELGQFHNSSKISLIESFRLENELIFIFGDQMGKINLLRWYD